MFVEILIWAEIDPTHTSFSNQATYQNFETIRPQIMNVSISSSTMRNRILDMLVMLLAFKLSTDTVFSVINTIIILMTYMMLRDLLRKFDIYLSPALAEHVSLDEDPMRYELRAERMQSGNAEKMKGN